MSVNICVEDWREENEAFYVADVQYDVILGLPWIQKNCVKIEARGEKVEVTRDGETVEVDTKITIPMVSEKEILSETKQGEEAFAIYLSAVDLEKELEQEDARVEAILTEYHDRFAKVLPPGLPSHQNVDFGVTLEDKATPPSAMPYRHSPVENEEIRRQIATMLERELIRPSISEYAAPVIVVKKKDGGMRMCIDYRALNKVTKSDKFPLPRIDDLLDKLGRSKYFSKMDLLSGYWQLRVREEDEHKLAFMTQEGLFEPLVLLFGAKGGPSVFQRLVNMLFANEKNVLVYLDDILIHSTTEQEHLERLR